MISSVRQKLTIVSLLLYWPALFILAHIPIPRVVYKAHVSDKSLHFLAYLTLAFLIWFSLNPDARIRWSKAVVWLVLLMIAGYAAIDELLQEYVGRSCDAMDFFADVAGGITGLIIFTFLPFWTAALFVMAIIIFLLTNVAKTNLTTILPIPNLAFHLFAYGIFTMFWLRYLHQVLQIKAPKLKWLIMALVLPTTFMLAAKLCSLILGRSFAVIDIIISVIAIIAVVAVNYLIALLRTNQRKDMPLKDS